MDYQGKSLLYKGVYKYINQDGKGGFRWRGGNRGKGKFFETEREAAVFVDKKLIERGFPPVNVLKRK